MSIARITGKALLLACTVMLLTGCGSDKKATLVIDLADVQAGSFLSFEISDYDTGEELDVFSIDNPGATSQRHELEVSSHDMPVVVEVSNILGNQIIQYAKAITDIDGAPIIPDGGETITISAAMIVPTVERD